MGWLDGWWKKDDDPLAELDPSLRDFLTKSEPAKYKPTETTERQSYRDQVGLAAPLGREGQEQAGKDAAAALDDNDRPLPKESLFQDGRYKHLWKSYRPLEDLEEAGKSDQEKLMDIIASFRGRQSELNNAATDNCSDEQWDLRMCFRSGGLAKRMTMCREENRRMTRCIEMQARFLRALGFITMVYRPPEETERIQMHADKLYHRMIDHENAVAEAKEKGLPPPPLLSVEDSLPRSTDLPHFAKKPIRFEDLPQEIQDQISRRSLRGLEGVELELAKREVEHSLALNQDLITRMADRYQEEYEERLERRAEGDERFGDLVKRYFDFRKYKKPGETAEAKDSKNTE